MTQPPKPSVAAAVRKHAPRVRSHRKRTPNRPRALPWYRVMEADIRDPLQGAIKKAPPKVPSLRRRRWSWAPANSGIMGYAGNAVEDVSDRGMNPREIRKLLKEVASMCERAYRRGAQQAVALGLSEDDASWYRYYGMTADGFYRKANNMPERLLVGLVRKADRTKGQYVSARQYAMRCETASLLDRLDMEMPDSHEILKSLVRRFK
jgi:hypothetical protein